MAFLGACGATPTLTPDDDGTRVDIRLGEALELVLPGNPSTGYMWTMSDVSPVLEAEDPVFRADSTLVGAPGQFHFRFIGREVGTVLLVLTYERSFEESEPADSFEVEVTVR
ncbi:MAG TPA: protease inhibitor I42 family protein [Acidimicrobiia bacterium]